MHYAHHHQSHNLAKSQINRNVSSYISSTGDAVVAIKSGVSESGADVAQGTPSLRSSGSMVVGVKMNLQSKQDHLSSFNKV